MDFVVYKLVNTLNGKRYIGSTQAFVVRKKQHMKNLNAGIHVCVALQKDWDKQKGKGFKFRALKRFRSRAKAYEYEALKIHKAIPSKIYNVLRGGKGGDAFTFNPNKGEIVKKHIANGKALPKLEILKRFSRPGNSNSNWKGGSSTKSCACGNAMGYYAKTCNECRERTGKNNPFYGQTHSRATKKYLSVLNKGKVPTNATPCKINGVKYPSLAEAGRVNGIPVPTVLYRIRSNSDRFKRYSSC